jgi:hypothetical protein
MFSIPGIEQEAKGADAPGKRLRQASAGKKALGTCGAVDCFALPAPGRRRWD